MAKLNLTLPPIQPLHQKEALLASAQESLWFFQQLVPQTVAYNSSFLFKLTGGVDRQVLERALNELVIRHESLRTNYLSRDGQPVQVIQPFQPFVLPFMDYAGLSSDECELAIRDYAAEHENIPFNLEQEISGRFALLHAGPEQDYLFMCAHHINWDAWSHHVLTGDLLQLYQVCRTGEQPDLPELAIQYSDYAIALNQWMTGDVRQAFVEHWKQILSGELPVLELPTDRPRPAVQTDHGARFHFSLPPALSTQIKEFCRSERITPYHFLLAAYSVLLMRYTGQEDIILGCPFANRPRPEQDGLVGLFVNVLPIRLNLENNPIVRDLLKQVRAAMLDAFTWQALPFAALASELAPQRDLSRTPIYQVMMNMLNVPRRQNAVPGLELRDVQRNESPAQFDLNFEFSDAGEHFTASAVFNTDLFDQSTIARMVSHFQNLLSEMLAGPDRLVAELEMLSESERHQILFEWNDTAAAYPSERCLHELIEAQVGKTPDALAVMDGNQQLSYCQLNERANQIAQRLRKMIAQRFIAGPRPPVGIYLERSADLIIAILGILKAGSAYVPLDIIYPPERRADIISDSGMQILITQSVLVSAEIPGELALLVLDGEKESFTAESVINPDNLSTADDLAYIIYTSGSTGKPKGVEITHRNVVNCLLSFGQQLELSNQDRLLAVTTPTFDISVLEMFLPLLHGASVVVPAASDVYDGRILVEKILENKISVMQATPSTWKMMFEAGWQGNASLKVLCGGEAFPLNLAKQLVESCGKVYNMYGPTETTIWSSFSRVLPDQGITVGHPIANTSLHVLDANLQLVPVGVTGELYIGGDGLARGYHNRPELTAEKFIVNPFSREIGSRLYKTGDLARFRPNGELDIVGRNDGQVKIRGFRIELGEVEKVLQQHPAIRAVVVIVREDQPGEKRLVGYLIPAGEKPEVAQIRQFLADKLPNYMQPSAYVSLDAFPLTANGKIDRKAFPVPEVEGMNATMRQPETELELRLVKIWMDVLSLLAIGIDDDFFETGGNSLLAVRLMTVIEREVGVRIPVVELFRSSTIRKLAHGTRESKNASSTWTPLIKVKPDGQGIPLFILHSPAATMNLANEIQGDWPVYGIEASGLEEGTQQDATIEQMAERYLEAIKTVQPQGPYRLMGYCTGGVVAYEMAQHLKRQGESVSLLVEMEAFAFTGIVHSWRYWFKSVFASIPFWYRRYSSMSWSKSLQLLGKMLRKNRFERSELQADRNALAAEFEQTNAVEINDAYEKKLRRHVEELIIAQQNYTPQPYPGRLIVFSARWRFPYQLFSIPSDPTLGWGKLARGGVDIYSFLGAHGDFYRPPYVSAVATALKTILEKLDQEEHV